jgi:hypothetical protein
MSINNEDPLQTSTALRLVEKIISCLPLDGLSNSQAEELMRTPNGIKDLLADLLRSEPLVVTDTVVQAKVDYSVPLERYSRKKLNGALLYVWVTSKRCPPPRIEKRAIVHIHMLQFDRWIPEEKVLQEMKERQLKPATIYELLALPQTVSQNLGARLRYIALGTDLNYCGNRIVRTIMLKGQNDKLDLVLPSRLRTKNVVYLAVPE